MANQYQQETLVTLPASFLLLPMYYHHANNRNLSATTPSTSSGIEPGAGSRSVTGSCNAQVESFLRTASLPSHRAHPLLRSISSALYHSEGFPSLHASSSRRSPGNDSNTIRTPGLPIICRPCFDIGPEGLARAYVEGPNPLAVVLCENRLQAQSDVEEALVHELVHVYDAAVRGFDLSNCDDLARSEVRAAREAECYAPPLSRMTTSIGGIEPSSWWIRRCIKQSAAQATTNIFEVEGKRCVQRVFEKALGDGMPWATNMDDKEKKKDDMCISDR